MAGNLHIVVVTGLSGSGKSTAIDAFEDMGYFCIDNLPVPLLPPFLKLCKEEMTDITKVALGIDIRERSFLASYEKVFKEIEEKGYSLEIIFLEASSEVLQRRYSQTRRVHPLEVERRFEGERFLLQAIHQEKELLTPLRERAHRIIDTSAFSVHMLKELIFRTYSFDPDQGRLAIQLLSFGYKYGIPIEAEIVMDLRFLPNPYFVESLKSLTGCNPEVSSWIMNHKETLSFLDLLSSLFNFLLPLYVKEGKRYLTIAFGCTGGKHRSVAVAEYFKKWFVNKGYPVKVFHRDIGHE
ncbi:MAG: RNase adapter RapZ [Syntrophobacterales bacterium]|nr:RNase adapter RapZ [Syntrophobacterales bacterium]